MYCFTHCSISESYDVILNYDTTHTAQWDNWAIVGVNAFFYSVVGVNSTSVWSRSSYSSSSSWSHKYRLLWYTLSILFGTPCHNIFEDPITILCDTLSPYHATPYHHIMGHAITILWTTLSPYYWTRYHNTMKHPITILWDTLLPYHRTLSLYCGTSYHPYHHIMGHPITILWDTLSQ